jgi:Bacterial protein of unknown function (DUF937)
MPNLIQTVMNALPPDAMSGIAGLVGESPGATTAGITAAIPALLAGALQKARRRPAPTTSWVCSVR